MKLLLILVGFFACMSVERVGFRKWSFVFRPGILFLLVMVALVCAGCAPNRHPDRVIEEGTGCVWQGWIPNKDSDIDSFTLSRLLGADGKQICRKPAP